MTVHSHPIPNMIQGVSQQAAEQRRDTQCEAQFDCINSVVDGATARPGIDLVAFLDGEDFEGAFTYEIFRGDTEHYLVVIKDDTLRVFDLADGTECTVNKPGGEGYLAISTLADRDAYRAVTVDDFTFIANREVIPDMDAATSAARPNEALFHFRAGFYSTKYQIAIIYAGTIYQWTYKTPDNSTSANADYIATNQLAATFYRAMTGSAAPEVAAGGSAVSGTLFGVAAGGAGHTSGTTGSVTATSLGFNVSVNGSTLRVWRDDSNDFDIDVADGNGGTHLKGIKGTAQNFSDLPSSAFGDFVAKIKGESRTEEDDYYVQFKDGGGPSSGFWQEVIKPGIEYKLDDDTMPWQLVNTDFQEFTLEKAPWGNRVAGDGSVNAKDPSFVGKRIEDLAYDHSRLLILSEGSAVWSKSRNSYVYFPDTVQTVLATAPIDVQVSANKQIALLRRVVQAGETLMLWAQKAQFRVHSNQEAFTEENIDAPVATNYEFTEQANHCPVGDTSLYFANEVGEFSIIRDIYLVDGKVRGNTDVTRHVPKYVPKSARQLVASDTLNCLFVTSDETPDKLYLYNWHIEGQERLQSAWNTWRLPVESGLVWIGVNRQSLITVLQRPDGVALGRVNLTPRQADPEGNYLTRLDLKITEADCSVTYDSLTDTSEITLPYEVNLDDLDKFMVVLRSDEGGDEGRVRGTKLTITDITGVVVTVEGNAEDLDFYAGFQIVAMRQESEFHLRDDNGADPVDRLDVTEVRFVHAATGYYRAEVTQTNGKQGRYEWEGRTFGDPANQLGPPVVSGGVLAVPVGCQHNEYTLTLINDSFLPSAWQSAEYHYQATYRAKPRGAGR